MYVMSNGLNLLIFFNITKHKHIKKPEIKHRQSPKINTWQYS